MGRVLHYGLNERNRNLFGYFLLALNLLSTLLSISLVGISIYVFFYFNSKAHLLGENLSFGVFSLLYIGLSVYISLQQICLCLTAHYLRRSRNRKTFVEKGFLNYLVYLYLFSTFIALPAMVLYSNWFISKISVGFQKGMKAKLKTYPISKVERIVFNELQFEYQCCGAQGYQDWNEVEGFASDDGPKPESVPFSCCKLKTVQLCLNSGRPQSNSWTTINKNGCAHVFYQFITKRVYGGIGLWLLILGLHLLSLILLQYWKTSIESALNSGKPKTDGEGWLWIPWVGEYKELKQKFKELKEPLIGKNTEKADHSSVKKSVKDVKRKDRRDPTMNERFEDMPKPPQLSYVEMPSAPPLSPRYNLLAPELSNKMRRRCQSCGRLTFESGTHVCVGEPHPHSSALMAITEEDLTGAEDSESSDGGKQSEYQKNYKNSPIVDKLNPKDGGKTSKDPRKVETRYTTTDDDTYGTKLDALKRKYRERYFILKEIR